MIYMTEVAQEKAGYIRFFNGAVGVEAADIFVNGELVVENLEHGAFSPYKKAKPGAYSIEVRIAQGNSDVMYSELISLMEDMAYTMAMAGDAGHLDMAIISLDLRMDAARPNVRFANLVPYDTVMDIEIDKQTAVRGLMYKEASEHVEIKKDNLKFSVTVINSDDEVILEDGLSVKPDGSYIVMIAGSMSVPESVPQLYMAEDLPML